VLNPSNCGGQGTRGAGSGGGGLGGGSVGAEGVTECGREVTAAGHANQVQS